MSEQALSDLREAAKRLAPDLYLVVTEPAIERCFGYGPTAYDAAEAFAKELHCIFIREGSTVRLTKAYPELGRDD